VGLTAQGYEQHVSVLARRRAEPSPGASRLPLPQAGEGLELRAHWRSAIAGMASARTEDRQPHATGEPARAGVAESAPWMAHGSDSGHGWPAEGRRDPARAGGPSEAATRTTPLLDASNLGSRPARPSLQAWQPYQNDRMRPAHQLALSRVAMLRVHDERGPQARATDRHQRQTHP